MLLVPKINTLENNGLSEIKHQLDQFPLNEIASVNWKEQYPSCPQVSFRMAHDSDNLYLRYFVKENEILALVKEDNGRVWTDSCVEFFISFDDSPYYYNLELSCIGKALLGYRKGRKEVVYGDEEVMSSIKRYSSLGTKNFDKQDGFFEWDLLVIIPVEAFWMSNLRKFDGLQAKANFYKCGDNLTTPHYLSWMPIDTEKPNFHTPDFFGKLIFNH